MNMYRSIAADQPVQPDSWHALLGERDAAKQAHDAFHRSVWLPLAEELDRNAPRPDLCFEIEAKSGRVARYSIPANDLHQWDDHWSPLYRQRAQAVREAWLAYRAYRERIGLDQAGAEADRLSEIQCDIETQLISTPAPDHAALLWKLDHLFGAEARDPDGYSPSWCAAWIEAVMDDARRLLGSSETQSQEGARR